MSRLASYIVVERRRKSDLCPGSVDLADYESFSFGMNATTDEK